MSERNSASQRSESSELVEGRLYVNSTDPPTEEVQVVPPIQQPPPRPLSNSSLDGVVDRAVGRRLQEIILAAKSKADPPTLSSDSLSGFENIPSGLAPKQSDGLPWLLPLGVVEGTSDSDLVLVSQRNFHRIMNRPGHRLWGREGGELRKLMLAEEILFLYRTFLKSGRFSAGTTRVTTFVSAWNEFLTDRRFNVNMETAPRFTRPLETPTPTPPPRAHSEPTPRYLNPTVTNTNAAEGTLRRYLPAFM